MLGGGDEIRMTNCECRMSKGRPAFGIRHSDFVLRRGATLLEMVVVIGIVALLMGLGVAVLNRTKRDLGLRAAAGQVVSILQAARAAAMAERSPARVEADDKARTVAAAVRRTQGLWHLESDVDLENPPRVLPTESEGAYGQNAKLNGGAPAPGAIGKGWRISPPRSILCPDAAAVPPVRGLHVELWAKPDDVARPQTVWRKGMSAGLRIEAGGELTGVLKTADGQARPVRSSRYKVRPQAWTRLELDYDGRALCLRADGAEVGRLDGAGWEIIPDVSPLEVGAAREGFAGDVDEIRISVYAAPQAFTLPDTVDLAAAATIRFDERGKLDPSAHAGPASIVLTTAAEAIEIRVGILGDMQQIGRDLAPAPTGKSSPPGSRPAAAPKAGSSR